MTKKKGIYSARLVEAAESLEFFRYSELPVRKREYILPVTVAAIAVLINAVVVHR